MEKVSIGVGNNLELQRFTENTKTRYCAAASNLC